MYSVGCMSETEPTLNQVFPVDGAYEDFAEDGKPTVREHLLTLTREGHLLEPGDELPNIPGIDLAKINGPFVLHVVNALETPDCEKCVNEAEALMPQFEGIPVFTLTKQAFEDLKEPKALEGRKQQMVTIDDETAIDLGVALEAGENADKEFWPTALRRSAIVVTKEGRIAHVEQPLDQAEILDFYTAFVVAESIARGDALARATQPVPPAHAA